MLLIVALFNTFTTLEDEPAAKGKDKDSTKPEPEPEPEPEADKTDDTEEDKETAEKKKKDAKRVVVPGLKQGIQDLIAQVSSHAPPFAGDLRANQAPGMS